MYEVWISTGDGSQRGPRFRHLADALRFISNYSEPASLALRQPDGGWHDFGDTAIVVNHRGASRKPLRRRINLVCSGEDEHHYWGRAVDASNSGIRVRLATGHDALSVGTEVVCGLESSYSRRAVCATVVWATGDERGLALAQHDVEGRAVLLDWLHDDSGVNTLPFGTHIVEVHR